MRRRWPWLLLCLALPRVWLAPTRRLRTPRRAEEESDWREFRARLVQQEKGDRGALASDFRAIWKLFRSSLKAICKGERPLTTLVS